MTTNFERIKNMTVDEMAKFLDKRIICDLCVYDIDGECYAPLESCEKGHKMWLEQECE